MNEPTMSEGKVTMNEPTMEQPVAQQWATTEKPWILAEVSEFLREHTRTTQRRVKRGELHPIILPGSRRLLFNGDEVRAFLAGGDT